jgi:multiple sugar transport system ATP-binding protein
MTSIRFENITKTFGEAAVIKGLDLAVRDGEFFTFVGPSGCGKSTILHLIAGLESPSGGQIFFDEKPVNRLAPKERDIALVFQNYALYPHMTVFDNIAFPLTMKKKSKSVIADEVNRVAGLLGIADVLPKKPKELSGGQRQRVALGRAIIRRPKVFLMDEPLSNLDARLRVEMRAELKRLHREFGITTVYVTHDQSEAMGLSDRLAVLQNGIVQQCDRPSRVYRYPANIFVAGFIGIPAMNILPATIRRKQPLEIELSGQIFSTSMLHLPVSESILAGIRPEDLLAQRTRQEGGLVMTVSVTEPAGSITWVELEGKDLKLRAIAKPEEDLRPGERCYLSIPPDRISLFDAQTGARL